MPTPSPRLVLRRALPRVLAPLCAAALAGAALQACGSPTAELRNVELSVPTPYAPAPVELGGQVVFQAQPRATQRTEVDWGDGSTDEVKPKNDGRFRIQHVYGTARRYTAVVRVKDGASTLASATADARVVDPVAAVTISCLFADGNGAVSTGPCSSVSGSIVSLLATSTGGFNAIHYRWDFGDGTTPQEGAVTMHAFAREGDFPVRVVASDSLQSTSAAGTTLQIRVMTQVSVLADGKIRRADAPVDQEITIYAVGEPPINIVVSWGDNTTTLVGNYPGGGLPTKALHSFTNPGTYVTTLQAIDRFGRTAQSNVTTVVTGTAPDAGCRNCSSSAGAASSAGASSTGTSN